MQDLTPKFGGCTSTNVHFQRVIAIPPLPHIAPDDADNRFKLSYVVMNPRNQSYSPQTFDEIKGARIKLISKGADRKTIRPWPF